MFRFRICFVNDAFKKCEALRWALINRIAPYPLWWGVGVGDGGGFWLWGMELYGLDDVRPSSRLWRRKAGWYAISVANVYV